MEELSKSVLQLIAKVDNLTKLSNDSREDTDRDVKNLNDSVNKISVKLDEVAQSQEFNNATMNDNIKNIKKEIFDHVDKQNTEVFTRITASDQKVFILEQKVNILMQRSRENNIELHGINDSVSDVNVLKFLSK